MNANEFLNEVLNSNIGPDGFVETYNTFQFYQNEALKTLKELHRVCEKNSIPYQLAFGSLLGIIRDGGQIPWDYDIDVIIPYTSKNDLIDALKKDLDEDFYFYCPENNEKCRHVMMRLAPKGYKTEALHVDVFYYIGTPINLEERKKFANEVKQISYFHFLKLVKPYEESTGNIRKMLGIYKLKLSSMFTSISELRNKYDILCNKYPINESEICIEADSFADWYEIPKEYLIETELINTNIGTFRISSNYRELLKIWYKDYLSIPPIEKRIEEVISNTGRLVYFDKNNKITKCDKK